MANRELCFIDLDGVLVNFVEGALQMHGSSSKEFFSNPSNLGNWSIEKGLGISPSQFWKPLNANYKESREFWACLPPHPEAWEIMEACTDRYGLKNVALLTAPSYDAGCVDGKRDWISHHFPQLRNQTIFTNAKQFLGRKGCILLDDKQSNLDSFESFGGRGFLVSREWNEGFGTEWQLMDELREWLNG